MSQNLEEKTALRSKTGKVYRSLWVYGQYADIEFKNFQEALETSTL